MPVGDPRDIYPYWPYTGPYPYYPPSTPPLYQSGPAPTPIPACWEQIACTMHKCRELGCACLRPRPAAEVPEPTV